MRVSRRPMVVLSTLVTLTAPVAAALVLTGSAGPAQATAPRASVAAEVTHAPEVVRLAKAPVTVKAAAAPRTAPRVVAVRPAPAKVITRRAVAPTTRRTATVTKPAPAPAPTKVAPSSTGNDYPYKADTTNAADPWGFTKRQCVSFAAFRLAQHGRALNNGSQNWGSALHWDEAAAQHGVAITKSPRVGAIAHWNAGESSSAGGGRFTAGSYGHVGYVAAVYADGTALIEQYNLGGDRSYRALRMTAPRYLAF